MFEDSEYADYGLQLALTVLAMAGTLLIDFSDLGTLVYALGIPLLLGHTAYISRNEFSKASSMSLIALLFMPLGLVTGLVAVALIVLNQLVSVFASGSSFRSFYGATSIPLILLAILIGLILAVAILADSGFEQQSEEEFVSFMTWKTGVMVEQSGVMDQQNLQQDSMQEVQQGLITSLEADVTARYVDKGGGDQDVLQESFAEAEDDLQQRVEDDSEPEEEQIDQVENQVESMTENMVEDRMLYFAIPLILLGLYALQPLLGLLTALSAKFFSLIYEALA